RGWACRPRCGLEAVRPDRGLRSFPTRRSSDLGGRPGRRCGSWLSRDRQDEQRRGDSAGRHYPNLCRRTIPDPSRMTTSWLDSTRSEEHTSELQSLAYLVCRLLLEKKNA